MNSWTNMVTGAFGNSQLAAGLFDVFLKSFVILALAGGVCLCWRRAAAAARHWVWLAAVTGALLMPGLSRLAPAGQRPLCAVAAHADSQNEMTLTLEFAPDGAATGPATRLAAGRGGTVSPAPPAQRPARQLVARLPAGWLALIIGVWLAGAALIIVSMLFGWWRLREFRKLAEGPVAGPWNDLLRRLSGELHLRRRVTLLQSAEAVMPVTWGCWHSVVLLPAEADDWSGERRRVVLLHELAHVKRWDCLTQTVARLACAVFWFNPLVWVAARRMAVERESACDDLVLNEGCKASDYAAHLVEIARSFRPARLASAIGMARGSRLQGRVAAIVDASRVRRVPRVALAGVCGFLLISLFAAVAAQKQEDAAQSTTGDSSGKPWYDERLCAFFAAKEKQAHELDESMTAPAEVWEYFDAGTKGDWSTATNLWTSMRQHAHQYEGTKADANLDKVWSPILETELAREQFANWKEKYVLAYGNDIIKSMPPGSIYFGGTDPGRGVITAMEDSQIDAKPFFTLTQNALADNTYIDYLQAMYGGRIYICSKQDLGDKFSEYQKDLARRYLHDHDPAKKNEPRQLKPGEEPKTDASGTMTISGQVSVMQVNGLLAKVIFDQNPTKEFYVEESFPLDWMYPHLLPNGLIMKVDREPLASLSEDVVRQDHEYWFRYLQPMIGDWLHDETPVSEVAAFADKVYVKHDLSGFTGDREFIEDTWAQKAYGKLRTAIGGVYAWRADHADSPAEKQRMTREADFAYRQAFALCPTSQENLYRYVQLLVASKRQDDALVLLDTALNLDPDSIPFQNLMQQVRDSKAAR